MGSTGAKLVDPLLDSTKEFYNNPYPQLKQLREQAPVFWSEKGQYWIISRYSDARDILGDLHFEKSARRWKQIDMLAKILPKANEMMQRRGAHMLNSNPPDHTRMRGLVNKAFTPHMVEQLRPRIEKVTNELLDEVQSKGKMDLIADFSFPLPAIVIAEMLGIPGHDRDRFKSWSHTMTTALDPKPEIGLIDFAKVAKAYSDLEAYLKPLIEERRANRKDDLISALVAAEEEGNKLNERELLSNIVLLLIAGHETTTNLIGNGTLALLQHPDQLARLKQQPELLQSAISECLRYDSPVQLIRRVAGEDMEIGDQAIKDDQVVFIAVGAVNRDPDQFPNPDTFDITRSPNKHLSFGHGIHHCLGSSLAEMEGQIAISTLFRRMPDLKLEPQEIGYKRPFSLRGLKQLLVSF